MSEAVLVISPIPDRDDEKQTRRASYFVDGASLRGGIMALSKR